MVAFKVPIMVALQRFKYGKCGRSPKLQNVVALDSNFKYGCSGKFFEDTNMVSFHRVSNIATLQSSK
jgi:hypothetical protein